MRRHSAQAGGRVLAPKPCAVWRAFRAAKNGVYRGFGWVLRGNARHCLGCLVDGHNVRLCALTRTPPLMRQCHSKISVGDAV